jgi:hypothetical protein
MGQTRKLLGNPIGLPAMLLGGPGMAVGVPGFRTASFIAESFWNELIESRLADGVVPRPKLTTKLAAKVAVDEAIRALMLGMARYPSRSQRARIRKELASALVLWDERGWLADPRGFHRTPPPLGRPKIERRYSGNLDFEHVQFKSLYRPRAEEPGRDRWMSFEPTQTAHAWMLRHRDTDRPWIVCIPGFRMGHPRIDFAGLSAARFHRDLGLNVMIPVLPLHGPRTVGKRSGDGYITADALNTVHAEAQAMWDIRRLIGWIRDVGAPAVGVYGVSLGGYNTALLTSLEPDLDCAIAGIPATCLSTLLSLHAPKPLLWLGERAGICMEMLQSVLHVVSPLAMPPLLPRERRFMFAGLADRLIPPEHVRELWEHWDRPRMTWYEGTHLSFVWERAVQTLVHEALATTGMLSHALSPVESEEESFAAAGRNAA